MTVRLAPSPTGRFHIGNLRTSLVAQLWAQILDWPLVIRFEDIDKPRVVPGAQEQQIEDLNKIGIREFQIQIQSQNHQRHWTVFSLGLDSGQIYPCFCSRKELQNDLAGLASAPHLPIPAYSGKCRGLTAEEASKKNLIRNDHGKQKLDLGWRFRGPDPSGAEDILVGRSSNLNPTEVDFTPSYQWACSLDDVFDGHGLLIRAWDLASSVAPQRMIQDWLLKNPMIHTKGKVHPAVFHTALVTQENGARMEKRTPGVTLADLDPTDLRQRLLDSIDRKHEVWKRSQYLDGRVWGEIQQTLVWINRPN